MKCVLASVLKISLRTGLNDLYWAVSKMIAVTLYSADLLRLLNLDITDSWFSTIDKQRIPNYVSSIPYENMGKFHHNNNWLRFINLELSLYITDEYVNDRGILMDNITAKSVETHWVLTIIVLIVNGLWHFSMNLKAVVKLCHGNVIKTYHQFNDQQFTEK